MTILVVDDNLLVREVVRLMLEARGYVVLVADGGAKALGLFAEHRVDVALVDMDMPSMNGLEVGRALIDRAAAIGRQVLVWLMTGVMRPEVTDHAARIGVLGVIPKPFTTREIILRIESERVPVYS
jgi:CheY-like chemotaxis protein